jgi:D-arabinose 1-dehydrogenase-like Zn-dependent alcohol dehydrogenase
VDVADRLETGDALRRLGGVYVLLHTANGVDPHLVNGLRPYARVSLMGGSRDQLIVTPTQMLFGKFHVMGSSQGPRHRLREALEFHAHTKARTFVEPFPLHEAASAYDRVANGSPRFRVVLVP